MIAADERRRRATLQRSRAGTAGAKAAAGSFPGGAAASSPGGLDSLMTQRSRKRGPLGPTPGSPAAETPPADPETVAREICLRLLADMPRTRAQLADALRRRNIP